MTTWNNRVVRQTHEGQDAYGIHEVYYAESGNPVMRTVYPVAVAGETVDELRTCLTRMLEALDKPVLTDADFPAMEAIKP